MNNASWFNLISTTLITTSVKDSILFGYKCLFFSYKTSWCQPTSKAKHCTRRAAVIGKSLSCKTPAKNDSLTGSWQNYTSSLPCDLPEFHLLLQITGQISNITLWENYFYDHTLPYVTCQGPTLRRQAVMCRTFPHNSKHADNSQLWSLVAPQWWRQK